MKKTIVKLLSVILYKLNKTESFNEMYEKLQNFANANGQNYIGLDIYKTPYTGLTIKAYVNSFNWVEGKTIEECIEKLEKYKDRKPEEDIIKEVLI